MLLPKQLHKAAAYTLAYLLKLISAQAWHVDRTLPTLKSDQNTLSSKVFNLRDVEAHWEDGYIPAAKAFKALCVMTHVATAPWHSCM